MKQSKKLNRVGISVILGVALMIGAVPAKVEAVSEGTIQLGNIIGNALTTVVRGLVQGQIKSVGDALKMAAVGGAAGYGFYQAKNMVASGHITTGMALANLSASVSENVALGQHPLAYIGYNIGFSRIRVATPLAKNPAAIINFDVSARDIVSTVMAIKHADGFAFKGGLFTFTAKESYSGKAIGWTFGPYATVLEGTDDSVIGHEAVHVVQNLQIMAASPYEPLMRNTSRNTKLFGFSGIRLDTLSIVNDLAMGAQDYRSQWKELEAFQLAGNK